MHDNDTHCQRKGLPTYGVHHLFCRSWVPWDSAWGHLGICSKFCSWLTAFSGSSFCSNKPNPTGVYYYLPTVCPHARPRRPDSCFCPLLSPPKKEKFLPRNGAVALHPGSSKAPKDSPLQGALWHQSKDRLSQGCPGGLKLRVWEVGPDPRFEGFGFKLRFCHSSVEEPGLNLTLNFLHL